MVRKYIRTQGIVNLIMRNKLDSAIHTYIKGLLGSKYDTIIRKIIFARVQIICRNLRMNTRLQFIINN